MRQTHREFQEFVTLVESKYAFWLPLAESPDLGISYDTWVREPSTLVVVRRLWGYVIDLDPAYATKWSTSPHIGNCGRGSLDTNSPLSPKCLIAIPHPWFGF